jgi:hypothetical protein
MGETYKGRYQQFPGPPGTSVSKLLSVCWIKRGYDGAGITGRVTFRIRKNA